MTTQTPDALPPVEQTDDPKVVLPSRVRIVGRALLGLGVGFVVAAIVARNTDVKWDDVVASFAGIPLWAVAACAASGFVMLGLQSVRWHAVMKPLLGLSYGKAYRAQLIGFMFNAILWGRAGDLLRVQYLGRRTGKSRATILGTEVVDRWLDFWGWIPTMAVLTVMGGVPSGIWKAVTAFALVLVSWAVLMYVLARRGWAPRPGSRVSGVWTSFRSGIEAFATRRTLAIAFGLAPLSWLWEAFFLHTITPAFGIHVNFTSAFCVLVGFNIATAAFPSPGNIGTEEAGAVKAFAFFGVDASRALSFMIVYHLAQVIPGVIAGIATLAAEGETLFGKKSTSPAS